MEINQQTKKRSSLFLSALSSKCTEDDLFKLFSQYGEIISVTIKNQVNGQESLAFGFVNFLAIKSAVQARNELNGTLLFGETLRIGWSSRNIATEPVFTSNRKIRTTQIHVSYISESLQLMVTNQYLRSLFSQYGEVIEVSLVQSRVFTKDLPHRQCGHGFVHFSTTREGIQSAFNAVQAISRQMINNVVYDCELSHTIRSFLLNTSVIMYNSHTNTDEMDVKKLRNLKVHLNMTVDMTPSAEEGDSQADERADSDDSSSIVTDTSSMCSRSYSVSPSNSSSTHHGGGGVMFSRRSSPSATVQHSRQHQQVQMPYYQSHYNQAQAQNYAQQLQYQQQQMQLQYAALQNQQKQLELLQQQQQEQTARRMTQVQPHTLPPPIAIPTAASAQYSRPPAAVPSPQHAAYYAMVASGMQMTPPSCTPSQSTSPSNSQQSALGEYQQKYYQWQLEQQQQMYAVYVASQQQQQQQQQVPMQYYAPVSPSTSPPLSPTHYVPVQCSSVPIYHGVQQYC